jgi:hypothetical protein
MRWAGHVASMMEMKNVNKILVGENLKERTTCRRGRKWMDDVKYDDVMSGA